MRYIVYAMIMAAVLFTAMPAATAGPNVSAACPVALAPSGGAVVLARLTFDAPNRLGKSMSVWRGQSVRRLPTLKPDAPDLIRIAGRCGSSKYYCNPPTPYCCGTSGNYYCAVNVNGCTR
ncbi:MAG: hypothetical protein ACR2PO_06390 [Methyloligellaceae bacterium]